MNKNEHHNIKYMCITEMSEITVRDPTKDFLYSLDLRMRDHNVAKILSLPNVFDF